MLRVLAEMLRVDRILEDGRGLERILEERMGEADFR